MQKNVTFSSQGPAVESHLYLPDGTGPQDRHPVIVVGGPMAMVREQSSAVFAEALAARGSVALAFDYTSRSRSASWALTRACTAHASVRSASAQAHRSRAIDAS